MFISLCLLVFLMSALVTPFISLTRLGTKRAYGM